MKPIENEGVIGDVELIVVQCDKLVAWIYAGACPILFLSILCSCWWWIVAGDASVTHTHSGICHVFVFTFIYFPWFFSTLQFVWEKMGRCTHSLSKLSCVLCALEKGGGCFLFLFFSSREISNPMNTVFPLLWATQSYSPHSSMDILYFFIEKRVQMVRMGFTISVICAKCVWHLTFFTHFISSFLNKSICDIFFYLKDKGFFLFLFFLNLVKQKCVLLNYWQCWITPLDTPQPTTQQIKDPALSFQSFFCFVFICVSFFLFSPFSLSNLQLCFLINPHFTYASHMSFSSPFSNLIAWQHSPLCHQNLWLQLSPISSGFIEIMCNTGMKMLAGKWLIRKIHKCIQLWQIFLDVIFRYN